MESFTKLLLFVTAVVVVVSLIEAVVLSRRKSASSPFAWYEVWIPLFDLAARRLMSLLPISVATPVFSFVCDHRIFTVDINSALMVFALFIGMEFCYYWYHRASHRVRFFWATHAVHHSPNQLTLSTAYRLGLIGKLTGSTLFFAPLVWLGVKPEVVLLTLFLNLMYQEGIDTYFLNVVRPTRLVVPHMKKQRGVIINISTAWALEPGVMFPTSAVALAGLSAFTKLFADAHASENIRMNNVPPGWIDSLPATEERRQSVPMQRYGTSEEIAATVAFLASDGAAYITGQNIRVDGGLTRSI